MHGETIIFYNSTSIDTIEIDLPDIEQSDQHNRIRHKQNKRITSARQNAFDFSCFSFFFASNIVTDGEAIENMHT